MIVKSKELYRDIYNTIPKHYDVKRQRTFQRLPNRTKITSVRKAGPYLILKVDVNKGFIGLIVLRRYHAPW